MILPAWKVFNNKIQGALFFGSGGGHLWPGFSVLRPPQRCRLCTSALVSRFISSVPPPVGVDAGQSCLPEAGDEGP